MKAVRICLLCTIMAVVLSACANLSKPYGGGVKANGKLASRGSIDDPRKKHFVCLKQHHLPATEPAAHEIQVGQAGVGPLIEFLATPGAAQYSVINGETEGAEVIGSSLLFTNQASDKELKVVEDCAALGVSG